MTPNEKREIEEEDILEQMQDEIEEILDSESSSEWQWAEDSVNWEWNESEWDETINSSYDENSLLAKTMADFDNYRKRVERDKEEMIHFLKAGILKKILPRVDDLERIINNTPKELQSNALYEGVVSTLSKLLQDLEKMGVKPFVSVWEEVNPDLHDVMTIIPWKPLNIVVDEFEKGYTLNNKVIRHAKVIAWWWEN